jgi:hypothetical protein
LDKAVTTLTTAEKTVYLKAFNPIKLLDLPPGSNVISSHHWFSIKKTSDGNLELKCRMVPHGNRDREKQASEPIPQPHNLLKFAFFSAWPCL